MNIVTLDFETMFDDNYTLKKLSTEEYIRDTRFSVHGVALKSNGDRPYWVPQEHVSGHLNQFDWSQLALLCHHAHFDGLILSHHFGIVPKAYLCTLSMARLLLGNHVSVSLDSVREHFGMPFKRTPYDRFKGRHWNELDEATRQEISAGACDEVESIWQIFNAFMKGAY